MIILGFLLGIVMLVAGTSIGVTCSTDNISDNQSSEFSRETEGLKLRPFKEFKERCPFIWELEKLVEEKG